MLVLSTAAILCAGCEDGRPAAAPGGGKSPFEHLIPKDPPNEANRVVHPAGYSLVYPEGWDAYFKQFRFDDWEQQEDGIVTDRRLGYGKVDFEKPNLAVIRFTEEGKKAVEAGGWKAGRTEVQFQNQPAWAQFKPGRAPDKVTRDTFITASGGYPYLQQDLLFERQGVWFMLSFSMPNWKKADGPYINHPIPIIEQYFETFQYKPN